MKATPVDTGRLRASITLSPLMNAQKIGTNVFYSGFVEYGTKKMEARHVEGGTRIYGQGYFAYGLQTVQEQLPTILGEEAKNIEIRFEQL